MYTSKNKCCNAHGTAYGFTLIELLITVAIIGILSAIAYPYYGEFVTKTRRSDAQVALLSQAQAMERCKATNYSYSSCTITTKSPEGYYTLAMTLTPDAATATGYSITATGDGVQENDSTCATLSINNVGSRSATKSGETDEDDATDNSSECWAN